MLSGMKILCKIIYESYSFFTPHVKLTETVKITWLQNTKRKTTIKIDDKILCFTTRQTSTYIIMLLLISNNCGKRPSFLTKCSLISRVKWDRNVTDWKTDLTSLVADKDANIVLVTIEQYSGSEIQTTHLTFVHNT